MGACRAGFFHSSFGGFVCGRFRSVSAALPRSTRRSRVSSPMSGASRWPACSSTKEEIFLSDIPPAAVAPSESDGMAVFHVPRSSNPFQSTGGARVLDGAVNGPPPPPCGGGPRHMGENFGEEYAESIFTRGLTFSVSSPSKLEEADGRTLEDSMLVGIVLPSVGEDTLTPNTLDWLTDGMVPLSRLLPSPPVSADRFPRASLALPSSLCCNNPLPTDQLTTAGPRPRSSRLNRRLAKAGEGARNPFSVSPPAKVAAAAVAVVVVGMASLEFPVERIPVSPLPLGRPPPPLIHGIEPAAGMESLCLVTLPPILSSSIVNVTEEVVVGFSDERRGPEGNAVAVVVSGGGGGTPCLPSPTPPPPGFCRDDGSMDGSGIVSRRYCKLVPKEEDWERRFPLASASAPSARVDPIATPTADDEDGGGGGIELVVVVVVVVVVVGYAAPAEEEGSREGAATRKDVFVLLGTPPPPPPIGAVPIPIDPGKGPEGSGRDPADSAGEKSPMEVWFTDGDVLSKKYRFAAT